MNPVSVAEGQWDVPSARKRVNPNAESVARIPRKICNNQVLILDMINCRLEGNSY